MTDGNSATAAAPWLWWGLCFGGGRVGATHRMRIDGRPLSRKRSGMGRTSLAGVALCLVLALLGAGAADAASPWPPHPYLTVSDATVSLARFARGSQACSRTASSSSAQPVSGWCVVADPVPLARIRLNQRVKAPFRGAVTLWLPEGSDRVLIGYGNQPAIEYGDRPAIVWPLPGSGTYYVTISVTWHTALAAGETTYQLPLYVPRS